MINFLFEKQEKSATTTKPGLRDDCLSSKKIPPKIIKKGISVNKIALLGTILIILKTLLKKLL